MRFPTARLLRVAFVCVAALTASACTGGDARVPKAAGSASRHAGGSVTVWADPERAEVIEDFLKHLDPDDGMTVRVQAVETDLREALISASAAGKAPDIVVGVHSWIGDLVKAEAIDPIDLSSSQVGKFTPIAMKAVTRGKKYYAVPFAIENLCLYRNTELVPDAPQTIEEVVSIGMQLKEAGRVQEALSVPVGQAGDAYHVLPLYTSGGAYLFGETKKGDLDLSDLGMLQPEAATAFTKIASLGEAGTGGLKRSIGPANAATLFTTSQSPFLISGPKPLSGIRRSGLGYAISPVPGFYGGDPALPFVNVPSFFLASGGKNKALAQRFVKSYLLRPELPIALYEGQPEPPALSAAFNKVVEEDPAMRGLLDAGRGGVPLPAIANMTVVLSLVARVEVSAVAGEDVASAVATAGQEMAQKIK